MEDLTLTRKILYGLGAYFVAMFIMSVIATAGGMLVWHLLERGETALAVFLVFGSAGTALYAAFEYRKRRVYESTKTWVTVAMAIFGIRFLASFFGVW